MSEFTAIPGPIVKAIGTLQAAIEAVSKTGYNKQGGYKFASTDDIYAAITRKMGEVGLMILPLEMEPPTIERVEKIEIDERTGQERKKVAQWGRFRFGFVLATEEATWFDPRSSRTLFIQILGPQTFNGAESYAQKQYLRGLLKLPTGDMDLDSMAQGETEEDQSALNRKRTPKSSYAAKKDGTTEVFNDIMRQVKSAPSVDVLEQIPSLYADEIGQLPRAWHDLFEGEYETRMLALNPQRVAAE